MQNYVNDITTVVDGKLEPLSNAAVTVYVGGTSTLATLYSDNGITVTSNPFISSNTGRVAFYAEDGRYDLVVSKTGYNSVSISDIIFDDPAVYTGPTSIVVNNASPALAIEQQGTGPALQVVGNYSFGAPVTKTSDFTVGGSENFIICDGAGTITVTLPDAASYSGRILFIKTITANAVDSDSSNVIPRLSDVAGTSILTAVDGKWAMLVSDGTNWIIMIGN